MLLLPYRADMSLFRFPWVTAAVCVVCIAVYMNQEANAGRIIDSAASFCSYQPSVIERMAMKKALGGYGVDDCAMLLLSLHSDRDPEARISEIAQRSEPFAGLSDADSRDYVAQVIGDRYRQFSAATPPLETKALWYQPDSWQPWSMVTASFAHADWMHLIGNLFFFFAFAATVEIVIGALWFAASVGLLAIGTHVFYSLAMLGVDDALPTLGLSGVVMGMIGLLAYLLPRAKIRCFYWVFVLFGFVTIPAWLLAAWFVGLDVWTLFSDADQSGINLIAHVSGAALGYLAGVALFRVQRAEVRAAI